MLKFSKAEVLENIKAKLGNTQKISDRSLTEMAEPLLAAVATDETELVDFMKLFTPMATSANMNLIKDQTDFVKTYEAAHPQQKQDQNQNQNQNQNQQQGQDNKPDTLADMRKIMEEMMSPVMQKITGFETKTRTESLIQSAGDLFNAKKPHPQWKGLQDKAKNTVNRFITADMTAESLAAEYDKEFNELVSASGGEGAYIPADNISTGIGAKEGSKEFYANQRKDMEAAGVIKKDD